MLYPQREKPAGVGWRAPRRWGAQLQGGMVLRFSKLFLGAKIVLAAGALFLLAGCQVVTSSLTASQIESFKLTGVTVAFDPQAAIWWGDGERAYAASKGLPATESESVAKSKEAIAYIHG